jgi:ActR/RegA family two-component response regulator
MKRSYIAHVLELLGNNVSLAAKKLKIHRHTVAASTRD